MGRAPCCDRNGLKKGPWTPEEDEKLTAYIQKHGYGNWRTLPKNAGLQRCGKSCRLRWTNYLRPDIKRGRFSFEEEETIIQLHSILGNKWSAIAARLPGRTDNEIKNYWNTHIRKRLLRMGIDPVTHSPRLDLLDLSSLLNSSLYYNNNNNNSNSAHHTVNLSRILGVQPLVNPEILRLATSLLSSQHQNQSNFLNQNISHVHHQESQNQSNLFHQLPPLVQASQLQTSSFQQNIQTCNTFDESTPCGAMSSTTDQAHLMQQNVEHFSSNIPNFGSENCQLNQWQSRELYSAASLLSEDYVAFQDYGLYEVNHQSIIMDPTVSETSTLISNSSNNFSFQSVLSNMSTPSSSPAPLNSSSNSTYNVTSISSSSVENERESYCSSMMKFEIPDSLLDVNQFM